MKRTHPILALLLAITTTTGAIAQPQVIGDLTQGALLGEIRDTAQLQNDFSHQSELLAAATTELGLSKADFAEVREDVAAGRARYVQIPRHLSGMAGQHHGRAFAVHDVVIPASVYGWEVDLERPSHLVRVFMPNRCGNISYLVVPRKQILAAAAPYHLATPAPAVAAIAPVVPVAAPPTPAPDVTQAPQTLALAPIAPAVATPVAHHFALLPWLALAAVGIAFMHGGGGTISTAHPPIVATPVPLHTICPPAVVHR